MIKIPHLRDLLVAPDENYNYWRHDYKLGSFIITKSGDGFKGEILDHNNDIILSLRTHADFNDAVNEINGHYQVLVRCLLGVQ
jgi:hypothetical protein